MFKITKTSKQKEKLSELMCDPDYYVVVRSASKKKYVAATTPEEAEAVIHLTRGEVFMVKNKGNLFCLGKTDWGVIKW